MVLVHDNGVTDENGAVSIPAEITETAEWRLVYRGDAFQDDDNSSSARVEAYDPVNERIIENAEAQEGKPYSYGADGPDSFDCSGLTQYVHEQVDIELPRTSDDQRNALDKVAKSDKRPGDLLFFHTSDGSVYHVGIYAGDNALWHAPQEGETVHREDLWTEDYSVGRAW
ncbi:MAG: C40 family peptidase [Haloechinothrix sp.]